MKIYVIFTIEKNLDKYDFKIIFLLFLNTQLKN